MPDRFFLNINTILFLIGYIYPYFFTTYTENDRLVTICAIVAIFILIVLNLRKLDSRLLFNNTSTIYGLGFPVLAIISILINGGDNYYHVVSPIMAIIGFNIILNVKLNVKLIVNTIWIIYLIYYINYFRELPSIYNRSELDFDEVSNFIGATSNSIAINLNLTLWGFIILNKIYSLKINRLLLIISIINIVLILIQNSRAGIIVAVINIILVTDKNYILILYRKTKKKNKLKLVMASLLLMLSIYVISIFEVNAFDPKKVMAEGRWIAQTDFLKGLDLKSFIFGYTEGQKFFVFTYTYNTILDVWNEFTIFGILFFLIFIVYRSNKKNEFIFPLTFLYPVFFYCLGESLFLPGHWDAMILMCLFTRFKDVK